MIKKIDHIAIAVQDLESALETFCNVLGCAPGAATVEEVPSEKVRVAFIPVGETKIELLQPLCQESPVSKFLEKNNGDGMHHIAFETDSIEEESGRLATHEIQTLASPKEGAGGKRIVFLHPKQTNRVLVEFSQHQKP